MIYMMMVSYMKLLKYRKVFVLEKTEIPVYDKKG